MKIILKKKIVFLSSLLLIAFTFSPSISYAETYITNDDVRFGANWYKEGSPYILDEDISINNGHALNIYKGVTVISASTTNETGNLHTITVDQGEIDMQGTKDDPIFIENLKYIYFNYSEIANFDNVILNKTGLDFWHSTSSINNTIIKNSENAINTTASNISINNSKIIKNKIGIASHQTESPPVLIFNDDMYKFEGVGGMGNATEGIADTILDFKQNIININNSEIENNTDYGILQESVNPINAVNNWWGNPNGPSNDEVIAGDRISGLINYIPWINKNIIKCCSNVLFLPGIEASRLYKDSLGLFGTSTNQLWEPNRNDDVRKLYLDKDGKSIDSTIYTKDILDSAFGLKSIYESFIAMMNSVVADGSIKQWLPYAYDWRMSVEEIVKNGDLIKVVQDLAKNSKTGKVIIIAHSNGGLVTKELLKALELKREGEIIEKVINVAVPELGTPQALLGLLHANNQSIFSGVVLSENNARTFSQNMSGAYGLLPSRKFFENRPESVISNLFSSSTYSTASLYDSMKNFLLFNSFSKASSTDINIPLILNPSLISISDSIHSVIDIFKPASTTKTLSIFGWGLPTSEAIQYEKDKHCNPNLKKLIKQTCPNIYSPILTHSGDGTVLTKTNSNNSDSTLFFNLKNIEKNLDKTIEHGDILESADLLNKIKDTVIDSTSTDKNYDKYFSNTEPIDTDKYLTIKVYSPVDIHIYDKNGNHTGIIENPIPGKDLRNYEKNIPTSYYGNFGGLKMIRVPYNQDYQILLKGTGEGVFSVDASITQFDQTIATISFDEMPVSTDMNGEMIIATSTETFSNKSLINIDENDDGIAEHEYKEKGHHKKIHKKIKKLPKKLRHVRVTENNVQAKEHN